MPIIQVCLVEGRDDATVKNFAKAVARTAHESLGAPLNSIRVIVQQVPSAHWAIGDRTKDEIDLADQTRAQLNKPNHDT